MTQEKGRTTQERDTKTSSKEPEAVDVEPKDLTPVKEKAQKGADEVTEAIDKALEENEGRKSDLDSLIDEVDAVLEENAEEFVRNYVQRGGQ